MFWKIFNKNNFKVLIAFIFFNLSAIGAYGFIFNSLNFLSDTAKGLSAPNPAFTNHPSLAFQFNPAGLAYSFDMKLNLNFNFTLEDLEFNTNDNSLELYYKKSYPFYGKTSVAASFKLIENLNFGFKIAFQKYSITLPSIGSKIKIEENQKYQLKSAENTIPIKNVPIYLFAGMDISDIYDLEDDILKESKNLPEIISNYNDFLGKIDSGFLSYIDLYDMDFNIALAYKINIFSFGLGIPISLKKIRFMYMFANIRENEKIQINLKNAYTILDIIYSVGLHSGIQADFKNIIRLGFSFYIPLTRKSFKFPFENKSYMDFKDKNNKEEDIKTSDFSFEKEFLDDMIYDYLSLPMSINAGFQVNIYKNYILLGFAYRQYFGIPPKENFFKLKKPIFESGMFYAIDTTLYFNPVKIFSFEIGYSFINTENKMEKIALNSKNNIFRDNIRDLSRVLFLNPIQHRINFGFSFNFTNFFSLKEIFHEISFGLAYNFKNEKKLEYEYDHQSKKFFIKKNYDLLNLILTYMLYF